MAAGAMAAGERMVEVVLLRGLGHYHAPHRRGLLGGQEHPGHPEELILGVRGVLLDDQGHFIVEARQEAADLGEEEVLELGGGTNCRTTDCTTIMVAIAEAVADSTALATATS
ncbi:hypothetical protein NL676_006317 [Syzygium grande]|nr:hypothetical protein NL676_006317 [Syzygium grande]